MKKAIVLGLVLLVLMLAVLSCRLPWELETMPVGVNITEIVEEPLTESETEVPIETPTETYTVTSTDAPAPSLPVVSAPRILRLAMFTPTQGWAVTQDGNRLLITQDGGETWLDATPEGLLPLPEGRSSLSLSPFFLDADAAWLTPVNSGVLYFTQDGGLTWSTSDLPFESARYFFLNTNDGFALVALDAGAGSHYVAFYRTEDGGETWTEVFTHEPGESKSLPESGVKNGITFLDELHGWIGGNNPMTDHFYLYYTADGGATWMQETDITLPPLYAGSFLDVWQPIFINDIVGYLPVNALGPEGTTHLLLYRSDDSGGSWTFRCAVQDGNAVDFISLDAGWVGAGAHLLGTTDGGVNWKPADAGFPAGEIILAVDVVDEEHGWVITTPDECALIPLKLYRTTDGGGSWTQLLP